ncbi:MAG TPA: M28 family peptidase [Terriglobia bacterium]|nr:M28 family peptidase [Terriglobia bacterium]
MVASFLIALLAFHQASPMQEDVVRIASATANEARFDALTALLTARMIPFTVEPFTIEKPIQLEPRTEGRNVVVTIGDGPSEIVIGAHYDAVRLPDGTLSKGAVDNAASTVILVRIAEALQQEKLPVRVRVVWFDMEELRFIGSQQYLKAHASDRILAMLNFDVNAYGSTVIFGPAQQAAGSALRRKFLETCASEDADCLGFPQLPDSDDRTFVRAGIPTLSIAMLPPVEARQLWLLLSGPNSGLAPASVPLVLRTIHTPQDGPDKVSEDSMAMMFRFAISLIQNIARGN